LPPVPDQIVLAELTPQEPRSQARGAAQDAFNLLFSVPFDEGAVLDYREPSESPTSTNDAPPVAAPKQPIDVRTVAGWSGIGLGLAGLGLGTYFSLAAAGEAHGVSQAESQQEVAGRNRRITSDRTLGVLSYGIGGAALGTGLVLLLWPGARRVQVDVSSNGGYIGYRSAF
jgi:hypothetical protein